MNKERQASTAIAIIFALRLLGPFMLLPLFTPYAHTLQGATPTLIGIALGIYGLSQAILQIPFGMLSDYIGRKPVILIGLTILILGSLIAAQAHSMGLLILGRLLQGAGAIGGTLSALTADLTQTKNRTKAMALIGIAIGITFSIALFLGPLLTNWLQVNGIFTFTALLAIICIVILYLFVPTPRRQTKHDDVQPVPARFKSVLTHPALLHFDFGIFMLHCILTATFVTLPMALMHANHFPQQRQWLFYLPILLASFLTMIPLIIIAEKKQRMKPIFLLAIGLLIIAETILYLSDQNILLMAVALWLFFSGFNVLEACLPSLISKQAPVHGKGTALGIYSSAQFLGIFVGGTLGGWLYAHHYIHSVFLVSALITCIWWLIAATMSSSGYLKHNR